MRTQRKPHRLILTALLVALVSVSLPAGRSDAFTTVVYNGAGSAPRIGIIGDSTIAALRWTNSFAPLRRFNFVYDAESCRRTNTTSCRGREGYAPDNVIATMRRLSGQWGSVLVLATGYDDPGFGFAGAVDAVMSEVSRQGIRRVMWLTMRTADVSYVSPTYRSTSATFRDNNRILLQKAQQYGGRLVIADWATYSAAHSEWFYADGIHYRPSGSWAAAEFVASQAARVLAGENITSSRSPGVRPWTNVRRGSRGVAVTEVQQALIDAGYSIFGGPDGVFGSHTETAVRRFQQANGLPVTGVVDANTAVRLGIYQPGGISTTTGWTELRLRMGGRAVADAQQALIDHGVSVRSGVSGSFDIWTFYAVQTFQRGRGLAATGVVDAATARALGLFSGPWVELRRGMTGSRVTAAQQALINRGIAVRAGATGSFDVNTYYAVQSFQRWQGLPVTGVIDFETARRLGLNDAPPTTDVWRNLSLGLVGPNVKHVQRALMDRRVTVRGGATGTFDVYTYYAVQTFQRYNGLPVTGIVDVATARALGLFDRADPVMGWTDLRVWSVGSNVASAQRALMGRGVTVRGGATGRFDIWTFYAVQTFQRYNGLRITGVIDVNTAERLGLLDNNLALAAVTMAAPEMSMTAPTTTTTTTSTTTTSTTTTSTTTTSTTTLPVVPPAVEPPTAEPAVSGSAVGDFIWFDANSDGRQDDDEPGVGGVVVRLLDDQDREIARGASDLDGTYEFTEVVEGTYRVEIELPQDRVMTIADLGPDDDRDSDAVELDEIDHTARTELFTVDGIGSLDSVDVGLVPLQPDVSPSSTAPTTSVPTDPPDVSEPVTTTEPATSPPTSGSVAPETTEAASTTTEPLPPETPPPTTIPAIEPTVEVPVPTTTG